MTSDRIRVALWGAGVHGRGKLMPALAAAPSIEFVGVASRDAAETLADPTIDAVLVATPTGLHAEHGRAVLDAGKHLWCEKPLAASDLVELGSARDLAVCEAFMYVHHPQFQRIAELVETELGRVTSLACRFGIPHQDRSGYRYRRGGGGALLDVGCYTAHLASELLGALAPVMTRFRGEPDCEVDLEGAAWLESATGARALLEWGYGLAYRNELSVWGERGALYAGRVFSKPPGHAATIVVTDASGGARTIELAPADSIVAMLEAFARTVRDRSAREREWLRAERQARIMAQLAASLPASLR